MSTMGLMTTRVSGPSLVGSTSKIASCSAPGSAGPAIAAPSTTRIDTSAPVRMSDDVPGSCVPASHRTSCAWRMSRWKSWNPMTAARNTPASRMRSSSMPKKAMNTKIAKLGSTASSGDQSRKAAQSAR